MLRRLFVAAFVVLMMQPAFISAQTTVTIGAGTSSGYYPLPGFYGYNYDVYLYDAANITSSGIITKLAYNIASVTSNSSTSTFKIYMKDVPASTTLASSTTFSTYISGATLVYDNTSYSTPSTGWNHFSLIRQFCHTQGNSLLIAVEGTGCSTSGSCSKQSYYTSATDKHWYKHQDGSNPGTSVSGTLDSQRANIILTFNGTCDQPAQGSPCDNAITMTCGRSYSGTLSTSGSWGSYPGCGYNEPGGEMVYAFTPAQTDVYTFSTTTNSGDPDFFLMSSCGNTGTNIIGSCWSSGNQTVSLTAGTTYYLVVDNYSSSSTASFSVEVSCPSSPTMDGCTNYTVGTGSSCTYANGPVDDFYKYSYRQIIYPAASLTAGTISALSFNYCYTTAMSSKTNVNIYLGHTNLSSFASTTSWIPISNLTLVYSGPLNCSANGWNSFTLTNPFEYNGVDNLVMAIDDNSNAYDGSSYTFYYTSGSGGTQLYYRSDSENPNPSAPPSGTLVASYPNTRFCIDDCEGTSPNITFANSTLSVNCCSTATNAITVSPNSGGTITYISSDPSVATVSSTGVVTAVSIGTATITALVSASGIYCSASGAYTVNVVGTPHVLSYNTTAGCSGTASAAPASVTGVTATVTATEPTCSSASYFAGWNTAADGSGITYNAGNIVDLGCHNVTLYAQYTTIRPAITGSGDCETAMPFCATNDSDGYTLNVETGDGTSPEGMCTFFKNPSWWYVRISEAGPLAMTIESSCGDVDFGCWGPFSNMTCDRTNDLTDNGADGYSYYSDVTLYYNYNTTTTPTTTTDDPICGVHSLAERSGNLVDFGGSTSRVEYLQIPNAQVGEYYMVVIGNFANCAGEISFTQTNINDSNAGHADCTIVTDCAITSITTIPTDCNASGTFDVSGNIAFNDAPVDGVLTITDGTVSQTFNPPFVSPISYTLSGCVGDGLQHTLTASFSSSTVNCERITYVDAPVCETDCPDATVTLSGYTEFVDGIYYYDVCLGTGVNMVASQTGYTNPTWTWSVNPHGGVTPTVLYGQSVSYTPTAEQGYDVSLTVASGECSTIVRARIRVSDGLETGIDSYALGSICVGDVATISVGDIGSDIVVTGDMREIETSLGQAGETFIPDGPHCTEQCYTSSVTFYDFNDGDVVTSVDDINFLRINMEHSFIGDLQIKLTCPNGRSAIILQDYYSSDEDAEHYSSQAIDPYSYIWPSMAIDTVWHVGTSSTTYYYGQYMYGRTAYSPQNTGYSNSGNTYYLVTFSTANEAWNFIENYLNLYYTGRTYEVYEITGNNNVVLYYAIAYSMASGGSTYTYFVWLTRNTTTDVTEAYPFSSREEAEHFIANNLGGSGVVSYSLQSTAYNRIYFGEPDIYDVVSDMTAAEICDGNDPHNLSAVGYDYAWTSSSNYTTSGYVYDVSNMSASSTIYNNGTSSANTLYHVIPSDVDSRTHIYQPYQSFANLIGCPLNGTWTVSVCDSWARDNGYIFNWELSLDESLMPNNWGYSVLLDDVTTNCGSIATVADNVITIEPQSGSAGDYMCNITLYDNLNCQTIIPLSYSVAEPTITLVSGSADQSVCEDVAIENIVYQLGGSATNAVATGLPAGVTMTVDGNTVTISGMSSNPATYNYTITTVSGNHCVEASLTGRIVVNVGNIVPEFNQAGPYCSGTTVDDLPLVSNNGITGRWTPNITNSTNTYTFTPDAGQCATITTMLITVNDMPTLAYTSGTETLCKNVSTMENIIFTYGGGANGADVTGLPSGVSYTVNTTNHTVVISGTPTSAGIFNYTVTTTGAIDPCTNVSITRTIVVNDTPTLVLTSGRATQTVCNGSAITPIVYTYGGGATGAIATNLPEGLVATNNTIGHMLTISGTPVTGGTISITTTGVSLPCENISMQASVNINQPATLELTAGAQDVVLCRESEWFGNIQYTFGGSATGINIVELNNDLPEGLQAVVNGSVVTISGTPMAEEGDYPYTITTYGAVSPCENITLSGTISIAIDATVELVSPIETEEQHICLPGTITDIAYHYDGGASGVDIDLLRAGLPAGLTVSVNSNTQMVTISGSPTETGRFGYQLATIGATIPCKNGEASGTLIINRQPELSVVGETSQQFCLGNSISDIVFTYGGGATGATVVGSLPAGLSASNNAAAHTLTISGTPTVTGTYNFSVSTTGAADPCSDVSIDASVVINSNPQFSIESSEAQICNGSSVTISCNPATFNSYQWTALNSSDATYTIVDGLPAVANASSISISPMITPGNVVMVYNLRVSDANGCTAEREESIAVSEIPTATISKTDNTKCVAPYNGIIALADFAGGLSGSVYTVEVSGQLSQTTTGGNIFFAGLAPGTYTVRITNSTTLNMCYTEETITIADNPSSPSVSISGSTSICENTYTILTANVTGTHGNVSYLWSTNQTTPVVITDNLSSSTTFAVTVTDDNRCTATNSVQVMIGNTPEVELHAVHTPICLGDNTILRANVLNAGASYELEWSATPLANSGLLSSTGDRITVTPTAAGSYTYSVRLTTNSCNDSEPYVVSDDETIVVNPLPTPGITNNSGTTTITCNTTEISLTATGGSSYAWSNGTNAATIQIANVGTYTVTVTDANSCSATTQIDIDNDLVLPNVSIYDLLSSVLTCNTTSITLNSNTTTPGATLDWTMQTVSEPGTYVVTATGPNGCQNTAQITITQDVSLPTVSILPPATTTLTCATPEIELHAQGTGVLSWTTQTVTAEGDYMVTATASNGCESTAQIHIGVDNNIPTVEITPSSSVLTCYTRSVSLVASGAFSYAWTGGSDGNTLNVTSPGTYTVTGTAANGCTATAEYYVSANTTPPTVSINAPTTELTCATPSISLTPSGNGIYSWLQQSVTTPGVYSVTATGTNGCTNTASITITQNIVPPSVSISAPTTLLTCDNPEITLTASGEGLSWSTQNVTTMGVYSVTATAANGCVSTDEIVINEDFSTPFVSIVNNTGTTVLTCAVPSISVSVDDNSDAGSYVWSGGANATGTGNAFTNPGTYYLTATGPNGCESVESITISQNIIPPTVSIVNNTGTTVLTCDLEEISVTAVGSASVVSYLWSEGISQATADNTLITIGTYVVTATASNGCTATAQIIITEDADRPSVGITNLTGTTVLTCETTEINVVATGTGIRYDWSGGENTDIANNTFDAIGTYYVTVTGANGCTNVAPIAITENVTPPMVSITNQSGFNEINCNASSVSVTATGNGISYVWSNGANTAATTFLAEGSYTVTATAANGCKNTAVVVITEDHTPPVPVITSANNAYTIDCAHPSLTLNVAGGLSYSWSTGVTGPTIMVTTGATYYVTATGTNGCTAQSQVFIAEDFSLPPASINNLTGETVLNCNVDEIDVIANGGYLFAWSNSLWGLGAEQTITTPGIYNVTVTGRNGCTADASLIITRDIEPPTVEITSSTGLFELNCAVSEIDVTAVGNGNIYAWSGGDSDSGYTNVFTEAGTYTVTSTGFNGCTNTAQVIVTSNMTPPTANITNLSETMTINCNVSEIPVVVAGNGVSFNWSDGVATANRILNSQGLYSVTVTGENGCTSTASIRINEDLTAPIALINNQTGTSELNCLTSSITLQANGGTSYVWSNGLTTQSIAVYEGGIYSVTVTGANGCTSSTYVTISQTPEFNASISSVGQILCYGGTTSASVMAEGGSQGYTYTWSDGQTTPMASNLTAGTYTVTVRDSGGCYAILQCQISQPAQLIVSVATHSLYCGTALGALDAIVSGGTAPYSYSWSNGEFTSSISNLTAGSYNVVVTDANNCATNTTAQVAREGVLTVSTEITHTISCHGYNDGSVMATAPNAVAPVLYSWNTGYATPEINNLFEGTYLVSVTDGWGCSGQSSITITSPQDMLVQTVAIAPKCHDSYDGRINVSAMGGVAPYEYIWNNGVSGQDLTDVHAGVYALTITDGAGCSSSKNITLEAPADLVAEIRTTNVLCYGDKTGKIEVNVSGGTEPYHYYIQDLSDMATMSVYNNMIAGLYTMVVVDNNGCVLRQTAHITQPNKLEIDVAVENPFCRDSRTGLIDVKVTGGVEPYLYYWNDYRSDVAEMANIPEGEYHVGVVDANGCMPDEKLVNLVDTDVDCLHIPNVFTPNGDGINDEWIINNIEMFPDAVVYVFNRWGQMMYTARGSDERWNGEYRGHFVPAGTYMYIIDLFNDEEPYQGTVTVLY